MARYVPIGDKTGDTIHAFYHEQMQINAGRMDRFVEVSNGLFGKLAGKRGSTASMWLSNGCGSVL
jgi:phospholipase C